MTMAEVAFGRWRWWLAVPAVALLILSVGYASLQFRSGIQVTVQNTGSTDLRSIVLHVTGKQYSLGDLAPGASAKMTVYPTSESHLEIEFTNADGKQRRLNAGGYFEPGYRGTIRITIKDDVIDENERQIELW
jgi:hypothetical protein